MSTRPSPIDVTANDAPSGPYPGEAWQAWAQPEPDTRAGRWVSTFGPSRAAVRLDLVTRVVADYLDRSTSGGITKTAARAEAGNLIACRLAGVHNPGVAERLAPALLEWLDDELRAYRGDVMADVMAAQQ